MQNNDSKLNITAIGTVSWVLNILWFMLILLFIIYAVDLSVYVKDFFIGILNTSETFRDDYYMTTPLIFFAVTVAFFYLISISKRFLNNAQYLKTIISMFLCVALVFSTPFFVRFFSSFFASGSMIGWGEKRVLFPNKNPYGLYPCIVDIDNDFSNGCQF